MICTGPPPTKKTKVSSSDGGDTVDFSKMKVAELREECEERGLESSGKKAELVSRLQAATKTGRDIDKDLEGGANNYCGILIRILNYGEGLLIMILLHTNDSCFPRV